MVGKTEHFCIPEFMIVLPFSFSHMQSGLFRVMNMSIMGTRRDIGFR